MRGEMRSGPRSGILHRMTWRRLARLSLILTVASAFVLVACSSEDEGEEPGIAPTAEAEAGAPLEAGAPTETSGPELPADGGRPFLLGSTPFSADETAFPRFRFDQLVETDIVSLHVDDFWGVPWAELEAKTPLPQAWLARWTDLAQRAKATGKPVYLSVSPLGDRRTLAPRVVDPPAKAEHWAPEDSSGCYLFASDAAAATHRAAYLAYLEVLVGLVEPRWLSPAIEVNVLATKCPTQKVAWLAWLSDVVTKVKAAHPALAVFPTVQLEHLYGIADKAAECPSLSPSACFDQRLPELTALPGDRLAFSTYPWGWGYLGQDLPADTFAKIAAADPRRIWIAETGWPTVPIRATYGATAGECGSELVPSSIASEAKLDAWASRLLAEADARRFEAVVWWESRDFLDAPVAATCPCPGSNATCAMTSAFRAKSAVAEFLLRQFGNMGLVRSDGTSRAAHAAWKAAFARPRAK